MAKGFVNSKTGQEVVLFNPNEKGRKAAYELKHDIRVTNRGNVKVYKKGRPMRLTDKDSAKAWRENQQKAQQGKN